MRLPLKRRFSPEKRPNNAFHVIFLGNHFWTCLYQSGILSESITSDRDVEVLSNGVGLVNVVSRTTASSQDLSSAEIREGCRRLVDKLQLLQVFIVFYCLENHVYLPFSGNLSRVLQNPMIFEYQTNRCFFKATDSLLQWKINLGIILS